MIILLILTQLFLYLFGIAASRSTVLSFDESNFASVHNTMVGSPALLKALAEKEEIIYTLVYHYMEKSSFLCENDPREVFSLAESYLTYFEATTVKLQLNLRNEDEFVPYRANNVAWNSLSVYHMMKRFRSPLKEFVRALDPRNIDDYALQKQILHLMKFIGWPTEQDLQETMSSILRIQHTYDLGTADIASGNLNGTGTEISLSPSDCNAIGNHALETERYALAVEWLEVSVMKFQYYIPIYEARTYVRKANLERDLRHAIDLHDRMHDICDNWNAAFFLEKVVDCPANKIRRRTSELQYWKGGRGANLNEINYWGVCSGENFQTEEEKSKLFCWYEKEAHAYWRINPLKAELLSFDPLQIVQYYDLIGSQMIDQIKMNAAFRVAKSMTIDDANSSSQIISDARTSWNSWIDDNNLPEFNSIPLTIEFITGLKVATDTSSEKMQVATYSCGSHYQNHLDGFEADPVEPWQPVPAGNRIATFLYYLSDVGKGGGTSFPQSGIATVPRKGSAVFWYNLLRSGAVDSNSWHGSCPVILGEKWIANKWIRNYDQMFSQDHKCMKDTEARFEMKVNGVPLSKLV